MNVVNINSARIKIANLRTYASGGVSLILDRMERGLDSSLIASGSYCVNHYGGKLRIRVIPHSSTATTYRYTVPNVPTWFMKRYNLAEVDACKTE